MNNSFFRWALLASACLSFGFHLRAQDLVKFPTGPAAWTIEVSDSPNLKVKLSKQLRVVHIEATQNESFMRSVMTFGDGTTRESWTIVGSYMMLSEDPRGTPFIAPVGRLFFIPFLPASFSWIQPSSLQEKTPIEYEGKSCFHYKGSTASSPSAGPDQTATVEAWIDSKTLLPVAIDDGQRLGIFTFHPPPATPLVMQSKYLQLYQGYKATMGIPKAQ